MDLRNQRPTRFFQDRGQPSVEDIYGEDWQGRNPMDFIEPMAHPPGRPDLSGTNPRDFVPNWNFDSLMRSLHPLAETQGPEPMNPFAPTPTLPLNQPKQMMAPKPAIPPTGQPITLPPEAFRDPSQFVTPIPPPQVPSMSMAPNSQEIDIPEIRNQAPQLPQSLPTGLPGIQIRPGNRMPIRGRYRF